MTDMPDIIIGTAEESFPWALSEVHLASGLVRIYTGERPMPGDDYTEFKTWRFKTEESRWVFIAARILDLRRDGAENINAPWSRIASEFPDKRLTHHSCHQIDW